MRIRQGNLYPYGSECYFKFCRLLLCTTNILIMILLLSVAEPEPVGAEVFWLEPEPIFWGRLRHLFLTSEKSVLPFLGQNLGLMELFIKILIFNVLH